MGGNITGKCKRAYKAVTGFMRDPFGIEDYKDSVATYYTLLSDEIAAMREHTAKSFDAVLEDYKAYAEEQESKASFYCMSLENIGDVLPDMIWMKWVDGKYAYANKAIKDGLLFDDNPVGKNDVILGNAAMDTFGDDNHNFGAYCAGSDTVVVEYGHRKRFIEYGMSGGRPLVLEVYKNVVRDKTGKIIATVGCGRDITDNIFTMFELSDLCLDACDKHGHNNKIINTYLDKYLFENDAIEDTLRDFYMKSRELYYEHN